MDASVVQELDVFVFNEWTFKSVCCMYVRVERWWQSEFKYIWFAFFEKLKAFLIFFLKAWMYIYAQIWIDSEKGAIKKTKQFITQET